MLLEFTVPFGRHVPGDVIELPEGVEYDHFYLKPHEEPAAKPSAKPTKEESK